MTPHMHLEPDANRTSDRASARWAEGKAGRSRQGAYWALRREGRCARTGDGNCTVLDGRQLLRRDSADRLDGGTPLRNRGPDAGGDQGPLAGEAVDLNLTPVVGVHQVLGQTGRERRQEQPRRGEHPTVSERADHRGFEASRTLQARQGQRNQRNLRSGSLTSGESLDLGQPGLDVCWRESLCGSRNHGGRTRE